MEISQIRSALPFVFSDSEKDDQRARKLDSDTVDVHAPELLADEDVEGVLNETMGMIVSDGAAALSVHSPLNQSRVFALLGL